MQSARTRPRTETPVIPIDHVLQHLADAGEGQLVKYGAKYAYDKVFGGTRRDAALAAAVDARLAAVLPQRLQDVIDAIQEHADARAASVDDAAVPGVIDFIAQAMEAAFVTDVESKRRLLGDLIAKRLTTPGDSPDDAALQLSISLVRQATETQLAVLAAVRIKESGEVDVAGDDAEAVEAAMTRAYGPIIRHELLTRLRTTDLDHLEAIGAIRQGSRASGSFLADGKTAAAHWFEARELLSVVESGSAESSTANYLRFDRERFPTIDRWVRLLQYPYAADRAAGHNDAIADAQPHAGGRFGCDHRAKAADGRRPDDRLARRDAIMPGYPGTRRRRRTRPQ